MKQFIHRILIAFFVVKILTVSVFPVGATNNEYVSSGSFWNWIADHGKFVQSVTGYFPGSGSCPSSEDTYHHASSYQKEGNVDGDIRYWCVCDYCHQSFTAYESDLQQSYEAQVEELPAQSITAAGKLIWQTTWDDYYSTNSDTCTTITFSKGNSATSVSRDSLSSGLKFGTTSVPVSVVSPTTLFLSWGNGYYSRGIALASNYLKAPVSGYYCIDNGF